jgi:hypothetical protein
MRYFRYTILLFLLYSSAGCSWHRNRLDVNVSKVSIPETRIHRYDRDLFKVSVNELQSGLKSLEPEYGYFLGNDLNDPAKLEKMRDYLQNPRNISFYEACEKKYADLSPVEKDLNDAFRHYRYYFPDAPIPGVFTYISGGEYENPVEISDSVMIIALDTYLGKDFKPYQPDGVPVYRVERMTADFIVPDCMSALIYSLYPADPAVMMLLGQMIEAGKRIYLLDAFIPDFPDRLKIGYTEAQTEWIRKNESHVWGSIIENRMLYSSKGEVIRIFLADGPFTSEFSNESPPRLGEWIGWQIVKAYMNRHPEATLQELMQEKDAQKILSLSSYKPGH